MNPNKRVTSGNSGFKPPASQEGLAGTGAGSAALTNPHGLGRSPAAHGKAPGVAPQQPGAAPRQMVRFGGASSSDTRAATGPFGQGFAAAALSVPGVQTQAASSAQQPVWPDPALRQAPGPSGTVSSPPALRP